LKRAYDRQIPRQLLTAGTFVIHSLLTPLWKLLAWQYQASECGKAQGIERCSGILGGPQG
jgi:hypothetical protein